MALQAVVANQWTERRRRAAELTERWPFAAEVLTFYSALLEVQERVYQMTEAELSDPSKTVAYVEERALPLVREVTIASGPEKLARAAAEDALPGWWEERLSAWLTGGELSGVERFLVRAATSPVLEVLGPASGDVCAGPRDERHCPRCGGLPQVSLFVSTSEDLVAPRHYLECARCSWRWPYPRMTCAACGKTNSRHLPIFAEEGTAHVETAGTVIRGLGGTPGGPPGGLMPHFPHISIHACRACSRYLLNVDLSRDAHAVPLVDEVAATPLDLYAKEQGMAKLVPNLMGF